MAKVKAAKMVQVQCRISREKYVHLKSLLEQAPSRTMSEIVRDILENRPVKLCYYNIALDQVMHQLSQIYGEIHRIGVNVNQFTKEFHQANQSIQKFLLGKKLIDNQQLIQREIESLKPILSELQQAMVVRINTGKNLMGILRYNELKKETGDAKLLKISGMLPGADKLSSYQLAKQFKTFTDLNSRTHTNALHLSLNFSPKDQLDDQKMEEIAEKYLSKIGFGAQPYLVYRHFDSGHPHLHIVTTNITSTGKRIETHNLGKTKSEAARKELEVEYGLVKADQQKYIGPDLKSMLKVNYGEQPTKAGLNAVINHVLVNYQFNSLAEFNVVLGLFQVTAYRGEKDSLRYKNRGLVFHFLDKKDKRIGVPVKASSFYACPTLDRLEKRYARAVQQKKKHKEEVLGRVLQVMKSQQCQGGSAIDKFIKALKKEGVACRLVFNESGRLYGVTYIDHRSGRIYKGSELDRQLAASGLSEHFGLSDKSKNIVLSPIADLVVFQVFTEKLRLLRITDLQ